jgi:hypothetical protein
VELYRAQLSSRGRPLPSQQFGQQAGADGPFGTPARLAGRDITAGAQVNQPAGGSGVDNPAFADGQLIVAASLVSIGGAHRGGTPAEAEGGSAARAAGSLLGLW